MTCVLDIRKDLYDRMQKEIVALAPQTMRFCLLDLIDQPYFSAFFFSFFNLFFVIV